MKLFAFLLVVLVGAAQAFVAPSAFKGTAMTSPRATRGERARAIERVLRFERDGGTETSRKNPRSPRNHCMLPCQLTSIRCSAIVPSSPGVRACVCTCASSSTRLSSFFFFPKHESTHKTGIRPSIMFVCTSSGPLARWALRRIQIEIHSRGHRLLSLLFDGFRVSCVSKRSSGEPDGGCGRQAQTGEAANLHHRFKKPI